MIMSKSSYTRPQAAVLAARLREPRRHIQVVAGPRQVGKSTLVGHVVAQLAGPVISVSADVPALRDREWLVREWQTARDAARAARRTGAVLVVDEIQKVADWSETVKLLWDEDTRRRTRLKVVLLGSAPLLIQQGLTESLAGRFEVLRLPHWSFGEMRAAFRWTVEEFIYYGGYPGAAPLIRDPVRWRGYILDSLVETTISRDVLLLTRVDKPSLLRRLFELGCRYSGQILSYTKMLGQLQDAGNATTLAHYLELLAGAGMVAGLQKFAGDAARSRGSSPKLQVYNTALMTAQSGLTFEEARGDPEYWGRLTESAVGAHLLNAASVAGLDLQYWRERNHEVDFVLRAGRRYSALEVKTARGAIDAPGLSAFAHAWKPVRTVLIGENGVGLEQLLTTPAERWVER
jgi:predicted AAA+ superfamily ATPase